MKKKKIIIITSCILGFFWIVGFIGNHSEWFGCKWDGLKSAVTTARKDLADKFEKRKQANAVKREKRERELMQKRTLERELRNAIEKEKTERETSRKAAEDVARAAKAQQEQCERKLKILKEFALRESPKLWQSVTELRATITEQTERENSLRKSLLDVGVAATNDADYIRFVQERKTLEENLSRLYEQLCDAYVASKKYDAEMGRDERTALRRLLVDDGEDEARATAVRFERMRREK